MLITTLNYSIHSIFHKKLSSILYTICEYLILFVENILMIFKIPTNFLLVLVAITSSIIANDNQLMMQNNT